MSDIVTREKLTRFVADCAANCNNTNLFQYTDMLCALIAPVCRLPRAGHVMLPDGKEVKVLGTLPMTADGCVLVVGARVYDIHGKPLIIRTMHLNGITADHDGLAERAVGAWTGGSSHLYSTPSSAAAAARSRE